MRKKSASLAESPPAKTLSASGITRRFFLMNLFIVKTSFQCRARVRSFAICFDKCV